MFRRQTLGQAIAGYRLLHPTPLGSWQEALYQTGRIAMYGAWDILRPTRHRYELSMAQFDAEEVQQKKEPRWYESAGVATEVVADNQ